VFEPDGGADQDLVPEPPYKVEEATDIEAEDRATAGSLPADVLPDRPIPSFAVLRGAFDVWQPAAG